MQRVKGEPEHPTVQPQSGVKAPSLPAVSHAYKAACQNMPVGYHDTATRVTPKGRKAKGLRDQSAAQAGLCNNSPSTMVPAEPMQESLHAKDLSALTGDLMDLYKALVLNPMLYTQSRKDSTFMIPLPLLDSQHQAKGFLYSKRPTVQQATMNELLGLESESDYAGEATDDENEYEAGINNTDTQIREVTSMWELRGEQNGDRVGINDTRSWIRQGTSGSLPGLNEDRATLPGLNDDEVDTSSLKSWMRQGAISCGSFPGLHEDEATLPGLNEDETGRSNSKSWSRQVTLTCGSLPGLTEDEAGINNTESWGRQITWESLGFNSRQVTEEFCPIAFAGLQDQNEHVTIRNGFVDVEESTVQTMFKSVSAPAILGDGDGDLDFLQNADTSLRRFESARPPEIS
jgi:hypothetical protein